MTEEIRTIPGCGIELVGATENPTCAIGGVFVVGRQMAACAQHGCGGNSCHYKGECEHKQVAKHDTPTTKEQ